MHAVAVEDSRQLHSIPAARVALIERIARSAGAGVRRELTQRFLRAYFHGVAEEDLAARTPQELSRAALAHLSFAARRTHGRSLVRVFNPEPGADGFESPHTLVLTVTDDMPFLVDSLGMAFARADLAVHLIVHPVLPVKRDRRGRLLDIGTNGAAPAQAESWQLYEIDRVTDAQALQKLQQDLEATLADVRATVRDWAPMRARVRALISELGTSPPPLPPAEISEVVQLLDWMEGRHFVFLGYRHYRLQRGRSEDHLLPERASGLGILARTPHDKRRTTATVLRGEVRAKAREPELLVLTKANATATVHRGELLDYVGVKTFDRRGRVNGEHRFLGLWTSTAYHSSPRDIPVLRHKVDRVIEHFGLDPASHDGKEVLNVLETYPRDELFQASVARPHPHRARRGQPLRAAHGAPAGAPRPLPPLLLLPGVRAARPLQHRGARAHRGDRARGLRRHRRGEPGADLRRQSRARARRGAHRSGAGSASPTSRASSGASRTRPSPGPTGCASSWSTGSGRRRASPSPPATGRPFRSAYEEDVAPAEVLEDLNDLEALRRAAAARCA